MIDDDRTPGQRTDVAQHPQFRLQDDEPTGFGRWLGLINAGD
ncbi:MULTISPECIES: hypothetical protein [Curtobacterium]|uniref:Uncharacterized protein n=2 Tax=Curtobacterium TaxID=2034 RepID=A0ABP4K2G6_9MICO|nr:MULTISPECIES: hypothetical protein [Curtobacterium]MBM7473866.1 hypothetical protein [Curtobacterium herbarum]MCP1503545.1 hypothetical protein [Curtobacterium herbarum]MCS6544805.1 hypothetical protein [Curtobacterium herbarum]MDN3477052.1 hypothetical protein [Curtobacterium sp. APC 4022]MDN4649093.1 hypothetical protein [Curtobacterium sp. PsM8]